MSKRFRVRELAQEKKITQEELSLRSKVKISTLRRIWQNNRAGDPRGGTLLAIAGVLGVSVEELYADEDESVQSLTPSVMLSSNKASLIPATA